MRKAFLLSIVALATMTGTASAHMLGQSSGTSWSGQTWHVENGVNGAGQRNCASHVSFGAVLTVKVYAGCGGTASSTLNRHQGTWTVTFKDTTGGGKYAILLWPQNGSRPEVDWPEDKPTDTKRILTTGTYHPGAGCNGCIHYKMPGNFTVYHTAQIRWTSAGFALYMDGVHKTTFPGGGYGGQMHISIHNEPWGSSGSSTLTVSKASIN